MKRQRTRFGLLLPATNTTMEHDLWSIVFRNQRPGELRAVALHTSGVVTPSPRIATDADRLAYRNQFLAGARAAVDAALLGEPDALIMGMSLEHILTGIQEIRGFVAEIESFSRRPWSTWHDAIDAALRKYAARRIGLLTPFDPSGTRSAIRMFEDLGYEVVSSVGFACATATEIARVPDWAKEQALLDSLATDGNRLDAVVQCGTNMSVIGVAERLEEVVGVPILGINAVTFWHALRGAGLAAPLTGGGRLLREH